jgi:hypothetical protein
VHEICRLEAPHVKVTLCQVGQMPAAINSRKTPPLPPTSFWRAAVRSESNKSWPLDQFGSTLINGDDSFRERNQRLTNASASLWVANPSLKIGVL